MSQRREKGHWLLPFLDVEKQLSKTVSERSSNMGQITTACFFESTSF